MKKIMTLTVAAFLLFAFIVAPTATYAQCAAGSHVKKADAAAVNATKTCSAEDKAACSAKLGLSAEDCEKYCRSDKYQMINMSIQGMTCTGCENSVSAKLAKVPGVVKVGKVSHKEGTAVVVIESDLAKSDALVTAVTSEGYKAEIIPAVATMQTVSDKVPAAGCSATKSASCSKTCGAKAACGVSAKKTKGTN